jgi:hypothetical protein
MGQAIGAILNPSVGVAISPLPIMAVILMLSTSRASVNGPAFVVGWLIGLAVVGIVALLIASPAGASSGGKPATWISVLKLALGASLFALAFRQWRARPRGDAEPPLPRWMGAVETLSGAKAGAAGAALTGANPKNLVLAVSAAAAIAGAGISGLEQAVSYAVFAVIATVGVAAPVVIYFALGDGARSVLDGLRLWLAHNNDVIMAVVLLLLGVKTIGDGVSGLTG